MFSNLFAESFLFPKVSAVALELVENQSIRTNLSKFSIVV